MDIHLKSLILSDRIIDPLSPIFVIIKCLAFTLSSSSVTSPKKQKNSLIILLRK